MSAEAPDRRERRAGRLPDLVLGPEFFEPLPVEELEAWTAFEIFPVRTLW